MNESRFTQESIADAIAHADIEANRSTMYGAKYARVAKGMRSALRKAAQADSPYVYYRFPSHRLAAQFRGYTVGY